MAELITGTLRMLGDRILLKPMDVDDAVSIQVVRRSRTMRGEVVAVGPGMYPIKYKRTAKGPKGSMNLSRHFKPTEVKVGDIVELGGLNIFDGQGYQFPEVIVNNVKHIVVTERDVALVRN